jgi:squalene-hopene/tetraprenyl-beta-curcumene cyclase
VLFLHAHRPQEAALERAAAFLQTCQFPNGGVATYADPGPIRGYMQLPEGVSIAGWCQPHASVTGAAGLAWAALGGAGRDAAERAWQYLLQNQRPEGYWESYWWTCPHYPTYLALALAAALDRAYRRRPAVRRAASWLQRTQLPSGGWALQPGHAEADFATALAVATLALAEPGAAAVQSGLARLRQRQAPDGGWHSRPILCIPPPGTVEPKTIARWRIDALGTGVALGDPHRLFTTATGLLGLSLATGKT